MQGRPQEDLKALAISLVKAIQSGETIPHVIDNMLDRFDFLGKPGFSPSTEFPDNKEEATIGVWKWTGKGTRPCYERDLKRQNEWVSWAKVHRIYPEKKSKRVLLLGESCARGYFYSPHYTVAHELEGILGKTAGMPETEIVDLARIGISGDQLQNLLESALILEPDAVVIFAGNNLLFELKNSLSREDLITLGQLIEEGSLSGMQHFLEKKMEDRVSAFLRHIVGCLSSRGIPLIFVIPEFNLADWRSNESEQTLASHSGENGEKWLNVMKIARLSLFEKDLLMTLAEQMIRLNPYNPLGHEILAHCQLLDGHWDEARSSLETARDTALVNLNDTRPRMLGIVRKTIVAESIRYPMKIVDLPCVFKEHFPGKIPDRNLFLDYCHLTVTGIKIAMQHTAKAVAEAICGHITNLPPGGSGIYPRPEVEAAAHFCAAIHNAHYGQDRGLVSYHFNKAISLYPRISGTMQLYTDFASRRCDTILCKSFAGLIKTGITDQYEGIKGFLPPPRQKLMDIGPVDSILDQLDAVGIQARQKIFDLRLSEHKVDGEGKDLLESYYCSDYYEELRKRRKPTYYQSRSFRSRFSLICDTHSPLSLHIVFRTTAAYNPEKTVDIRFNDSAKTIFRLPAVQSWTSHVIQIDRDLLFNGINEITIEWPFCQMKSKNAPVYEARDLANILCPVQGEISTFTAYVRNNDRNNH